MDNKEPSVYKSATTIKECYSFIHLPALYPGETLMKSITQILRKPLGHLLITALLLSFCQLALSPQLAVATPTSYDGSTVSDWNLSRGNNQPTYQLIDSVFGNPAGSFNFLKNDLMWKTWGVTGTDFEGTTIEFDVSFSDSTDLIGLFWGAGPGSTTAGSTNDLYIGPMGNASPVTFLSGNLGLTTGHSNVDAYWGGISGGISGTGDANVTGGNWLVNTWYTVKLIINKTSTSYYVNNVLIQTITSNLPNGNEITFGGDDRNGYEFTGGVSIDNILITPSLIVSSISPSTGPTVGGTLITITGTNFETGAAVTVGGNACATPVVASANSITCTTPAGSAGAKDVVVTNLDSATNTFSGGFTYLAPSTITYDLNYPSSPTAPTQAPVAYGSTFEVAANPIRSGFQFMGWSDNGVNNGNVYGGPSYISKTYTVGSSNITLAANWESLAHPIIRTVHQNLYVSSNIMGGYFGGSLHTGIDVAPGWCVVGGTGSDPSWFVSSVAHTSDAELFTTSPSSVTYVYGEAYQYSPDPAITISTGGTQTVAAGTAITSTTTTNTGCGANKYSISPTLPSNLSLDTTTGVISGTPSAAQASTSYTLTAERWVDANGNLDITGTKIGYSSATFTLTVTAAPSSTNTVTYNLNGGRYEERNRTPTQAPVASGTVFKLATSKELTKIGFTFGGWSDGSTTYAGGASYTMGGSYVVFTATWIAKQYRITWNIRSNNATSGGTSGATTYTAGSSIVTLPTDAVRSGKVFKGWYTSAKGGTKITSGYLVASPFGDVTFYAQFA